MKYGLLKRFLGSSCRHNFDPIKLRFESNLGPHLSWMLMSAEILSSQSVTDVAIELRSLKGCLLEICFSSEAYWARFFFFEK